MRILPIVLLALAVRLVLPLGALSIHGDAGVFYQADTNSYLQPARALVEDGSFTASSGRAEIARTPGYPFLLTLGVLVGNVAPVTIAAQILLGVGTVLGVGLLARRVAPDSPQVVLWAVALYALDPLSVLYCSLLMTETLFTAVLVVHLLAVVRFLETRSVGAGAVAGALASAAMFVRPIAFFWPLVAVAVMLCAGRRAAVRGCAAFLVAATSSCARRPCRRPAFTLTQISVTADRLSWSGIGRPGTAGDRPQASERPGRRLAGIASHHTSPSVSRRRPQVAPRRRRTRWNVHAHSMSRRRSSPSL